MLVAFAGSGYSQNEVLRMDFTGKIEIMRRVPLFTAIDQNHSSRIH